MVSQTFHLDTENSKQEQHAYRSYKIWQTCVKHGYLFLFLKPV